MCAEAIFLRLSGSQIVKFCALNTYVADFLTCNEECLNGQEVHGSGPGQAVAHPSLYGALGKS